MHVDVVGLTEETAAQRRLKYGENILPEQPRPGKLVLFLSQLKSPLIFILLAASAVTVMIGDITDAVIILFAVLINTVLGYVQEERAGNALAALNKYVTHKSIVIRDGKRSKVDTAHLVPGDIVVLEQGSKVPADGTLLFANRMYVDESLLTGESVAVIKKVRDAASMGTTVVSGQGIMEITATGTATKMGAIATQIQKPEGDTPLQRQLGRFSRQLVVVIGILTISIFVLGILYRFSIREIFLTSVALAVSSIPEGLPISLTVVLAIGMQRILKHKGLVRRLSAAETLGGVTVICVDKTGTLTEGKTEVVGHMGDELELAQQVLLANDLDDPMLVSAYDWGKHRARHNPSEHRQLDSIPFSPKERFFMSLHEWSDTRNMVFVNGAPELLLSWSTMPDDQKNEIRTSIEKATSEGKRVVGFARKYVDVSKQTLEVNDANNGLVWTGMLLFTDPVRLGVKESLAKATAAGIRTIVITGDFPHTSKFVLSELGIDIRADEIMLGEALAKISPEALRQRVKTVRLFARTTPDQKHLIVDALKQNGEIVAMMGDGVNDAPALHAADIGVVVGEATDVAKESADLVLLDSNFRTIVKAIEEGRSMFENIRKIILYLMTDAFSEIIVVIGSILLNLPLAVTAVQILWINLVSDGFPNLSLTVDPKRKNLMDERPRDPKEKLVNTWMMELIGLVSLIDGLIALTSFVVLYRLSQDVVLARSFTFIVLGLNSLVYVFSIRTLRLPFWIARPLENIWLVVAVMAGSVLQFLPFASPSLIKFFGLTWLSPMYWMIAVFLAVVMFFMIELFKFLTHERWARASGMHHQPIQ